MTSLRKLLAMGAAGTAALLGTSTHGSQIIGGDAADLASASSVLDIVFAIDTSGSMSDDIAAFGRIAERVVTNLECPDCDVYIRARFMGITTPSGTLFNETVYNYVGSVGGTRTATHQEDNGPAVADLANYYQWHAGLATDPSQKLVRAVVTIGDEGTDNGQPVDASDYAAADLANQTAIDKDVLVFSWVADDPYAGVPQLFQLMAEGGTNPAYPANVFGATGGVYVQLGSGDEAAMESKLEEILCIAGGGGVVTTPDGGWTLGLLSAGVLALAAARRK